MMSEVVGSVAEALLDPRSTSLQIGDDQLFALANSVVASFGECVADVVAIRKDSQQRGLPAQILLVEAECATLLLEDIHELNREVGELASLLGVAGLPCRINAYLSPFGGDAATYPHADGADAVMVQLMGQKMWSFGERIPDYGWSAPASRHIRASNPKSAKVVECSAGSLVRVKCGQIHYARTSSPGVASLHLSVSSLLPSYPELLMFAANLRTLPPEVTQASDWAEFVGEFSSETREYSPLVERYIVANSSQRALRLLDLRPLPEDWETVVASRGYLAPIIYDDSLMVGSLVLPISEEVRELVSELWLARPFSEPLELAVEEELLLRAATLFRHLAALGVLRLRSAK